MSQPPTGKSRPGEDSYSVLGVAQDATAKEIASAYRSLALRYHPDKNASAEAALRFEAISQAYKVLTDVDARHALDALLASRRALAEREATLGDLRRTMRDDLLRREQVARKQRLEQEAAQAKLQQELDRLRREAERKRAIPPETTTTAVDDDESSRTLKVSLAKRGGHSSSETAPESARLASAPPTQSLTPQALDSLLSPYGAIANIVVSPRGQTALVVFDGVAGAMAAMADFERGAAAFSADHSDLLITWAHGPPPDPERLPRREFESLTLMRMRQHAERAKLRAKLAKEAPDGGLDE